jgi:hydrogenase expression/formation protein HypC
MCVGVPGKVLDIDASGEVARVHVAGVDRRVMLSLFEGDERPVVGDYVLVYTGMALAKIDEAEAQSLQRMLDGDAAAYDDYSASLMEIHEGERT